MKQVNTVENPESLPYQGLRDLIKTPHKPLDVGFCEEFFIVINYTSFRLLKIFFEPFKL